MALFGTGTSGLPAGGRGNTTLSGTIRDRIEIFLVRLRPVLPFIHVAMFIGFVVLIVAPVAFPDHPGMAWLGETANWLIWALWFPLVFLSVIAAGRSWCGVLCPMGAASEWMNRIGLKRPVPRWLQWGGTPIVSFVFVTILGQTVGVRDYASAILEVFGATLIAALIVGFLYGDGKKKRAWCRHACPIGLLLGVFSRMAAVDLTPKRPVKGGDRYVQAGICPTMIDIKRKTESRHCVMCMRCVHPDKKGGLKLQLRAPGSEIADIRHHNPMFSEVWFLFLGTGVALGGFLWLVLPQYQQMRQATGLWALDHGWNWIGLPGPYWLMVVKPAAREVFVWLDFFLIVGWMVVTMVALTAALALLISAASWIAGRFGGEGDFKTRFRELGYQVAPAAMLSLLIGLGGDLFKMLPGNMGGDLKLFLLVGAVIWGGYLGVRILRNMGVKGKAAIVAMVPGIMASAGVAAAWWPAVASF